MDVRYLAPARIELAEAARHYAGTAPHLGINFLDEVDRVVSQLVAFPDAAPVLEEPVHRKVLHKFPYSLLYIVDPGCIVIVAVMHHKREPGYWEERIS